MKKMLFVMVFLVLVGMLWGASACSTSRHWSIGDRMYWALERLDTITGDWIYYAPFTVPPGNRWDTDVGGTDSLPWEKLYDMPGARWIGYDALGQSAASGCEPEVMPPIYCYHRYTLWQFWIPDTITRATAWFSVDDFVTAIDMRNLNTDSVYPVPIPVAGFEGFGKLHRLDLTDLFRDLPSDGYQMEIYVCDIRKSRTGLIFYLSYDRDDTVSNYIYNFSSGTNLFSMPYYPEGYPALATLATLFPTAAQVRWKVPGSLTSFNPPCSVSLFGAYGDTIRTYTMEIDFPSDTTCTVYGTSIWEKRYLDIKNDIDDLYFSSVDCYIEWPSDNSPDDFPDGKILKRNTIEYSWNFLSPNPSPERVTPTYGYKSEPVISTLPYHLDIITEPCCGEDKSGGDSILPLPNYEYISYPTPEATWARIRSVMALVHVPDSAEIKAYLDSLDSSVKLHSADTIDTSRSSPKKTIEVPKSIVLNVYPNPFNAVVSIVLSLPNEKIVHLAIYDLKGKVVECLSDGQLPTGNHVFTWDGSAALDEESTSGVFFVKALIDEEVITKKIQLVK